MDLQNAFYLMMLIFLSLGIFFLLGCIGFLFFLFLTIRSAKKQLGENIDQFIAETRKKAGAANMGFMILGSVLSKLKNRRS